MYSVDFSASVVGLRIHEEAVVVRLRIHEDAGIIGRADAVGKRRALSSNRTA